MVKKTDVTTRKTTFSILIGCGLILLAPVLFCLIAFSKTAQYILCSTAGDGCGYNGMGIIGYALYAAIATAVIGFICLLYGMYSQYKDK